MAECWCNRTRNCECSRAKDLPFLTVQKLKRPKLGTSTLSERLARCTRYLSSGTAHAGHLPVCPSLEKCNRLKRLWSIKESCSIVRIW